MSIYNSASYSSSNTQHLNQVGPRPGYIDTSSNNVQWNQSLHPWGSTTGRTMAINMPVARKPKRVRTAFTSTQMMKLEEQYQKNHYLDRNRRLELAELLKLNERTIKIWFQNRRMKEKKDRAEGILSPLHQERNDPSPVSSTQMMLQREFDNYNFPAPAVAAIFNNPQCNMQEYNQNYWPSRSAVAQPDSSSHVYDNPAVYNTAYNSYSQYPSYSHQQTAESTTYEYDCSFVANLNMEHGLYNPQPNQQPSNNNNTSTMIEDISCALNKIDCAINM